MRKKLRKGKKSNRVKAGILMFFVVLLISVIVAFYQYQPELTEPVPADEYFEIFDAYYIGFPTLDGSLLTLDELTFKIKAVGGEANHVHAMCGTSEWELVAEHIEKGQTVTAYIDFYKRPFYIPISSEEFTLRIRISSLEAQGEILVNLQLIT